MEVIATKLGVWNGSRVRPGTKFEVPDGTKSTWFVPAAKHQAKPPAKPQAPIALSQLGSQRPQTMTEVLGQKGSDLA